MRRRKFGLSSFRCRLADESGIHRATEVQIRANRLNTWQELDQDWTPRRRRLHEDARQYLVHLERMNSVYYDQIKIADQKAAFIFTFMLAFLVSSAEGSSVFRMERYQTGSWPLIVLSAVLAVAIAVSLVSAILVVLPRHRTKATSLYWGAWPANRELFIAAHEARDPDYLFNEYLEQRRQSGASSTGRNIAMSATRSAA